MNHLPRDNNHKNNKITSSKISSLYSPLLAFSRKTTCWDIPKMDSYNWISPSFANAPTLGPCLTSKCK